ncbi:hypothetical protein [Burkholderia contaminans]|uniref:hypothetical protein n=1 Tax=Burkholderia contaminans TaxID=488447 RepID=UPI00115FE40E|nr:hypothetical protein [Burkholderia contaminans]
MKHSVILTGSAPRQSGQARAASGVRESPEKKYSILLHGAAAGVQACNAGAGGYINFETFRASGHMPGNVCIAGTLDTPGFRPAWPALCVSVGTAVDEVTTGRFRQKTDGTRVEITCGNEGRSASGNMQLQVDQPPKDSSSDP